MDESNKQIQQPEEERTLEEAMEQEVTLEESFRLYHRGIDLLKACSDKIDRVEKQIQILDEEGESHGF